MRLRFGPKYPPLQPGFSYLGSKSRLASKYPAPLYQQIIEPFAGSAGYSSHWHWHEVFLLDINPTIIAIWDKLKTVDETLYDLPDDFTEEALETLERLDPAMRALVGHWLARGSSTPRSKLSPRAQYDRDSYWSPRIKRRLVAQRPYLEHWINCLGSYRDFPNMEACWFFDAPYQRLPNSYPCPPIDYEDLGDYVMSRWGQVIVCEGGLADRLPDWLPFEQFAPGRKKTSGKKGDTGLNELLWYRIQPRK